MFQNEHKVVLFYMQAIITPLSFCDNIRYSPSFSLHCRRHLWRSIARPLHQPIALEICWQFIAHACEIRLIDDFTFLKEIMIFIIYLQNTYSDFFLNSGLVINRLFVGFSVMNYLMFGDIHPALVRRCLKGNVRNRIANIHYFLRSTSNICIYYFLFINYN